MSARSRRPANLVKWDLIPRSVCSPHQPGREGATSGPGHRCQQLSCFFVQQQPKLPWPCFQVGGRKVFCRQTNLKPPLLSVRRATMGPT